MPEPVGHPALWDRIWSRSSYARPALRAARARNKADSLDALGVAIGVGDRVLDLGCGSGHMTIEVASRQPARGRWVACDRSTVAAAAARSNVGRAGLDVPIVQTDAATLPFRSGSFDAVLAFMVFQHLDDGDRAMAEVARVLVAQGTLVAIVPGRRSLASLTNVARRAARLRPFDRRTYTVRQLLGSLDARFEVEAPAPWQLGFDRPIRAMADRALATLIPSWGRYLVVRCRKRARG